MTRALERRRTAELCAGPRGAAATSRTSSVLCAATLVSLALVAAPARGQGSPASPCSAVLVPLTGGRGVPAPVIEMANSKLAEKLTGRGCRLVEAKAVASMKRMVRLPRQPQAADWARLGKSLLADVLLAGTLASGPAGMRIELTGCVVSTSQVVNRSSTVPAADALATLLTLADEVLPAPAPPPASAPASAPASQPAPPPPPKPAPPPPPKPAPIAPPPPPLVSPAPAPPPPPIAARRTIGTRPALLLATGLRVFRFFETGRTGPALDLEIGALGDFWRMGVVFSSMFGDNTGYMFGGRADVGPRFGPVRLMFGAALGLVFAPNVGDALDLLVFRLHCAGAMLRLRHIVVMLDAFTLDFNVIPGDITANRDPELMMGFSSGVTVGVYF